jgi:hypothetical protein
VKEPHHALPDPATTSLRVPGPTVHLDPMTVRLLRWHACRQRLDRRRAGPAWRMPVRVFTDETVTIAAAAAGLPPATFAELRDFLCLWNQG